jgi:hypothetical protein
MIICFGHLNIVRFILLVLMFVVSVIFLIISPNAISILLGWDGYRHLKSLFEQQHNTLLLEGYFMYLVTKQCLIF